VALPELELLRIAFAARLVGDPAQALAIAGVSAGDEDPKVLVARAVKRGGALRLDDLGRYVLSALMLDLMARGAAMPAQNLAYAIGSVSKSMESLSAAGMDDADQDMTVEVEGSDGRTIRLVQDDDDAATG